MTLLFYVSDIVFNIHLLKQLKVHQKTNTVPIHKRGVFVQMCVFYLQIESYKACPKLIL